jgi:D-hexose-6-phosphate mutarotase
VQSDEVYQLSFSAFRVELTFSTRSTLPSQLSVLNTEGWADTVIWNPYGNEGMGYNNFVCVESVKFDPVTLDGGASWTGVMALKPTPLES